jgi:hypothetical protein
MLKAYRCLVRPVFDFGAPIWFPNTSKTSIKRLQVVLNEALCFALGCLKKSSIAHLHSEACELRVKSHLKLLCDQFLASAMRDTYPSNGIVKLPQGPRKMKQTLYILSIDSVRPFLYEDRITELSYKRVIKTLHTCGGVCHP